MKLMLNSNLKPINYVNGIFWSKSEIDQYTYVLSYSEIFEDSRDLAIKYLQTEVKFEITGSKYISIICYLKFDLFI